MKKLIAIFLTIAMVCTMVVPVSAAADNYVFTILVNGQSSVDAEIGDTITVSITLSDPTEGDTLPVYIFQDYILYDADQLALDEDSIETPSNIVQYSTHSFTDEGLTSEAVFLSRYSTSSTSIGNGATLITFDLEVIGSGTLTLAHHQI